MRVLLASLFLSFFSVPVFAIPVEMDNTPVRDFVRWYSDETGNAFAIDPSVSGQLTVYAADVSRSQLSDFFRGVLESNDYRIVNGNPPTIVPASPGSFVDEIKVGSSEPLASSVYSFDNVRASDIAPVVTSYLDSIADPGTRSPKPVVLPSSNSLLVSAPRDDLDSLDSVITSFDVPYSQVLIKAVIYETTEGDTFDLGVAFGSSSGRDVAGGFNTDNLGPSLSVNGASFGVFDGDVLALALQALRRDSNATVLSTPQVLTLSGDSGRLSVGQNVPFVTGRVTGEAADVDSPFQTIEREDVGVSLDVSPVVTSSGLVIMDVKTQADSISDSLQASDIITNQRSISTTVQVRSGQTVLLGGLVSDNSSETVSGVPVLSSIPVIGRLFQSRSSSSDTRKLNVLLSATVVSAPGGVQ